VQRVLPVLGFAQIRLGECLAIDDQHPVRLQIFEVDLQRRRVHRHQYVAGIAGREDLAGGKMQLEAAHAGERARRGADLRGKIRQRAEIVAGERRFDRELRAGELHAVAGVAGETNDDRFQRLTGLRAPYRRRVLRR
jgi:hypothetical protein